ncbi:hypothetical protein D3C87_1708390 [compost metagenome]
MKSLACASISIVISGEGRGANKSSGRTDRTASGEDKGAGGQAVFWPGRRFLVSFGWLACGSAALTASIRRRLYSGT